IEPRSAGDMDNSAGSANDYRSATPLLGGVPSRLSGAAATPMISFIIPAHNEERLLGRTLEAIQAVAKELGEPHETIVVDDASTDRTAAIAAEHGARVVSVSHRQIGATRNSGGRAAQGNVLFFVDADTVPTIEAVRAGRAALRAGAMG